MARGDKPRPISTLLAPVRRSAAYRVDVSMSAEKVALSISPRITIFCTQLDSELILPTRSISVPGGLGKLHDPGVSSSGKVTQDIARFVTAKSVQGVPTSGSVRQNRFSPAQQFPTVHQVVRPGSGFTSVYLSRCKAWEGWEQVSRDVTNDRARSHAAVMPKWPDFR
uniref:Uncharacterized protein n=1 Tax=Branchiostoma floridae TaxID=7739 RepID=C3YF38_BRAFL|eukprot:XP_002605030.1 hypothetical protein BRAFLDRAFT_85172 [Branchiostoma floridae]